MSFLKRAFATLYPAILGITCLQAGLHLYDDWQSWSRWGVLVALFPMLAYYAYIFIGDASSVNRWLPWQQYLALLGVFISLFDPNLQALLLIVILGPIGINIYILWATDLPVRHHPQLKIGKPLPHFRLQDTQGDEFDSDNLVGRLHLLIFIRGNWCPFCVAQLKELSRHYQVLEESNINVLVITPQPRSHTEELAKRNRLPMRFLVDDQLSVSRLLGIEHPGGVPLGFDLLYRVNTVLPTVLLTDLQGRLVYAQFPEDYRDRPDVADIVHFLENRTNRNQLSPTTSS